MTVKDEYINFEVLNERFIIKSEVPKDYYLELVKYLEGKIQNIKTKVSNLSSIKLITFAALDIADELMRLKETSLGEDAVRRISDLSDSLASVIEDED